MSQNTPNINDLFQQAHAQGDLSSASLQALSINTGIGTQIQAALGVAPEDVPSSEVVLVTMMPDDSGSIRSAGNEQAIRTGHNQVLQALKDSKQKDGILAHTRYLNGEILFPYRALDQAIEMTVQNYQATRGTPLFDQTVTLLGTVLAKTQEFEDAGVPVRTITLILTDGADAHSVHHRSPQAVRPIVEDMLRKESHIIAAMGIADGHTDFGRIFQEMGIPDEWILTPSNSETEIRAAFRVFSQSAVRASQSTGNFSQAAMGGFAMPFNRAWP